MRATGLMCGLVGVSPKTEGGGLSSREAFSGLMRKMMILAVVLLAVLLDFAVAHGAGVQFNAVTGAVCLWFIASEGLPIPGVLKKALEVMKSAGDGEK